MNTTRRWFLGGASLLAVTTALIGCATKPTPASVATDVTLVAQSFSAEMSRLTGLVSAANQAKVAAAIGDMTTAANAFISADTQAAQQTVVKRVETDINAVFLSLPTAQLPAWAQTFINDVNALLPVIELAVGLITAAQPAAVRGWSARVTKNVDPATARLDLAVIVARKP